MSLSVTESMQENINFKIGSHGAPMESFNSHDTQTPSISGSSRNSSPKPKLYDDSAAAITTNDNARIKLPPFMVDHSSTALVKNIYSGDEEDGFSVLNHLGGATNKSKRKQVKNACVNCQKACKKCDDCRPCTRCVKFGLEDSCRDSERKERKKGIKRGPYNRNKKNISDAAKSLMGQLRFISSSPNEPFHQNASSSSLFSSPSSFEDDKESGDGLFRTSSTKAKIPFCYNFSLNDTTTAKTSNVTSNVKGPKPLKTTAHMEEHSHQNQIIPSFNPGSSNDANANFSLQQQQNFLQQQQNLLHKHLLQQQQQHQQQQHQQQLPSIQNYYLNPLIHGIACKTNNYYNNNSGRICNPIETSSTNTLYHHPKTKDVGTDAPLNPLTSTPSSSAGAGVGGVNTLPSTSSFTCSIPTSSASSSMTTINEDNRDPFVGCDASVARSSPNLFQQFHQQQQQQQQQNIQSFGESPMMGFYHSSSPHLYGMGTFSGVERNRTTPVVGFPGSESPIWIPRNTPELETKIDKSFVDGKFVVTSSSSSLHGNSLNFSQQQSQKQQSSYSPVMFLSAAASTTSPSSLPIPMTFTNEMMMSRPSPGTPNHLHAMPDPNFYGSPTMQSPVLSSVVTGGLNDAFHLPSSPLLLPGSTPERLPSLSAYMPFVVTSNSGQSIGREADKSKLIYGNTGAASLLPPPPSMANLDMLSELCSVALSQISSSSSSNGDNSGFIDDKQSN